MMNASGSGTLGCGHPQKPGTRFCTVCGQSASAYEDGAYEATQTVTTPRRVPPQAPSYQAPAQHSAQPPAWQQGPGWQGDPGWQPPGSPPESPRRSPWLLAAGIAASLLLVGGAGGGAYLLAANGKSPAPVVTNTSVPAGNTSPAFAPASTTPAAVAATTAAPATTPPTTAAPAVTEQQAATGLSAMLAHSVSIRNSIASASQDAGNCGGAYAQDAATFRQAAAARRDLIRQLDSLPGAQALPAQMLSDLRSAWQASATADDDYAHWADDEAAAGCTTSDSWYAATSTPNQQATNGKMAFIVLWNPIASRYSLPTYDQGQL
jgi:hypothetical protein